MSKAEENKGKAKKAAGDLSGNKDLEREGKADETSGKFKQGVDRFKNKATGKSRR
jgi:uncharacterized protein YjbJ (UPF0337 family)